MPKMGLFKRKRKLKNAEFVVSLQFRPIKYITTRDENGVECVLGRRGSINIRNDEIIVSNEQSAVFRCNVFEADIGELLSKNGVRISGINSDGKHMSLIAHFVKR